MISSPPLFFNENSRGNMSASIGEVIAAQSNLKDL